LLFIAIVDNQEKASLDLKNKTIIFACLGLIVTLVCTAMYIFSPIGTTVIALQGRYFIPPSPLFYLLFYNRLNAVKLPPKIFIPIAKFWPLIALSWTLFVLKIRYYG
jgi:uncharacterized membrane protein